MRKAFHAIKRHVIPLLPARIRRRLERAWWESRWKEDVPTAPWMDRDVSPEVVEAVDDGWFVSGTPAIDLGCGRGDVAAWLSGRGFPAVGIDIAPSAVAHARRIHGEVPGRLEFVVVDVCTGLLPDRGFGVLVDRGCFHQLDGRDREPYASNVRVAAAPNARFLLFVKAFRDGRPIDDPEERARHTREVEGVFGRDFTIDRVATTHLDRKAALPGLVFWMTRRGE